MLSFVFSLTSLQCSLSRKLIVEYNFDGIDLDWEYPGYKAHSGTPADKGNFNLLLRDIKVELDNLSQETGRQYGLTAALPCGPSNIENIDIITVADYLTEFNLMSYDFHGAWDATTGVNSPLYDQSNDPERGWSVDGCVKNWVARGAPQERLNIGLGFYGRSFKQAKDMGVAHTGTDDTSWAIDEGSPQYFNIMEQINSMSVQWDDETQTPYAVFTDKGGLVSYDDERSICLKTEYADSRNLNGFIIWELSGDVMEDLSTPLLDMVNRKLSERDTNCADPFGSKLETQLPPITSTVLPEAIVTTTVPPETTTTTTELPKTFKLKMETDVPPAKTIIVPEITTMTTEPELPNMITEETTTSLSSVLPPSPSQSTLWASSSTLVDGRRPVQRLNRAPIKPYRPPKDL